MCVGCWLCVVRRCRCWLLHVCYCIFVPCLNSAFMTLIINSWFMKPDNCYCICSNTLLLISGCWSLTGNLMPVNFDCTIALLHYSNSVQTHCKVHFACYRPFTLPGQNLPNLGPSGKDPFLGLIDPESVLRWPEILLKAVILTRIPGHIDTDSGFGPLGPKSGSILTREFLDCITRM